ncbi:hypothetical protein BDN72DRAFT_895575 [Pluteus cervinus]|uniref:Uncharacterized protein n=1 Tax=Pluteus cervinus TaxID=181527 RepID=A0ACD3B0F4_9AGAR|nr:hypothetical protein BDN72DRAFT_895575 [Pluteus cervinus]
MAEIKRIPKSAKKWTANDLLAFNIHVLDEDAPTFFGIPNLPASTADPEFLDNETGPPNSQNRETSTLFGSLNTALEGTLKPPEAFVEGLLWNLLFFDVWEGGEGGTGYISIVGEYGRDFLADVLKESSTVDSEPGLIAEAIAAFFECQDNHRRFGNAVPSHREIPGIILRGTAPTFYRIPVTDGLIRSIGGATYPNQPTTVHRLIPVEDVPRYFREGMKTLENRRVVMQCFEAFKGCLPC